MTKEEKREILEELKKELYESVQVKVFVCRDGVSLPEYANIGDAGMDVRASEDIVINPGETRVVPTGLRMVIPCGYEIQVRPRSGMSLKTPLRVANTPGTIDSGYRGEIGVILWNSSDSLSYTINKGDRIAQIVMCRYVEMSLTEVDEETILKCSSKRGTGGFGSTGIN